MKRILVCAIIAAVSVGFTGCADMQTVGKVTAMPASTLPDPGKGGGVERADGVAIHLDAQQRLVLVKPGGSYCAEPSPDALAAYAASLGMGLSAPSQGAASVATALQSSAGSIGLRTQSITLMRDALYRMCEAYENRAIGKVQVATLLGRSQDLTAVVLAVEQLTGAVAGSQVILTGTAGAGASANLLSNQQLLDAARKDEQEKKTGLEAATKERDDLQKSIPGKEDQVKKAKQSLDNLPPNAPEGDKTKLQGEYTSKKTDLEDTQSKLAAAQTQVDTKQKLYEESKKTRETIENIKDSAMTSAVASTSSAGQFGNSILQRKELSKEATESIAKAVQGMVEVVLHKNYALDSCMSLLTSDSINELKARGIDNTGVSDVTKLCLTLVKASINEEIYTRVARFGSDASTEYIIKACSGDPTLEPRIEDWLKRNRLSISVTMLKYGKEYEELRQRAIKDLKIDIK